MNAHSFRGPNASTTVAQAVRSGKAFDFRVSPRKGAALIEDFFGIKFDPVFAQQSDLPCLRHRCSKCGVRTQIA